MEDQSTKQKKKKHNMNKQYPHKTVPNVAKQKILILIIILTKITDCLQFCRFTAYCCLRTELTVDLMANREIEILQSNTQFPKTSSLQMNGLQRFVSYFFFNIIHQTRDFRGKLLGKCSLAGRKQVQRREKNITFQLIAVETTNPPMNEF